MRTPDAARTGNEKVFANLTPRLRPRGLSIARSNEGNQLQLLAPYVVPSSFPSKLTEPERPTRALDGFDSISRRHEQRCSRTLCPRDECRLALNRNHPPAAVEDETGLVESVDEERPGHIR